MDDKFNEQKDTLVAIKKEISLLHQQVDYLIRNGKPLELLDLDVMMNRTHTIYDLMCGVEVNNGVLEEQGEEKEELPVGLDEIRAMFGIEDEEKEDKEEEPEALEEVEEEDLEPLEEVEKQEEHEEENETEEENEDAYFIEEVEDETEEEAPIEDKGFILNFEPVEETVEEPEKEEETSVFTSGDEVEMIIPHLDFPAEEEEQTDDKPEETIEESEETTEEPEEKTEEPEETAGEDITYEPVVIGSMEEKEDGGFELETPETLGERLQQEQDPTLADKLQHSALNSLQSAIGINDKFLFVNELFNGSMEKYNRSIANLDDLKTLNGALIYMNELRIELQWNSSNEAYKKLVELVHRKFGA